MHFTGTVYRNPYWRSHSAANSIRIVAALEHQISHGDLDWMAAFRRNKRTL